MFRSLQIAFAVLSISGVAATATDTFEWSKDESAKTADVTAKMASDANGPRRPPNFFVLAALAASRQLQNGPRRFPDGSRLHQDAPRRPREPRDGSRRLQAGPK